MKLKEGQLVYPVKKSYYDVLNIATEPVALPFDAEVQTEHLRKQEPSSDFQLVSVPSWYAERFLPSLGSRYFWIPKHMLTQAESK